MKDVKLKQCPFCGSVVKKVKGIGGIQFFECENRKCGAMVSFREYEKEASEEDKWNRRVKE